MAKEVNVLILDDEEDILTSVKRLFLTAPFSVATTTDPQEAMAIIEKENIKLILSDHRMPKMSGVEFLKKARDQYPDILRILFTGFADFSAAEEAINVSEVYRFVSKPWDTKELKLTVNQALIHYDLVIENRKLFQETKTKNEELEVLNRKLKNMYAVQKEFTSTASHELRTPLASIKSSVDLVLSEAPGKLNEDQAKFLQKAKNNVDRLNRLINDILDLTKLESGKSHLEINFHPMDEVIKEIVETHQQVAEQKNLYLKTEIHDDLEPIPFDMDKMHQVLNNLINNAIKFTDEGGITILYQFYKDKNYIEVAVQDTGAGIKEDERDKLFQKFQQLGDSRKHVGGTGLGLAICQEIIQRHGGKIWVESPTGNGSSFHFILPIKERRGEEL